MARRQIDSILLVRPPEFIISSEKIRPERQIHGAVLLPLGIMQLGAYVRNKFPDISIHYLDLHLKCKLALKKQGNSANPTSIMFEELKSIIHETRPQIIGVSCALSAFEENYHQAAKFAKQIKPDSIVMMGGNYVCSYPHRALEDNNIDYIMIGEGELPFIKFIQDFQAGQLPKDKIANKRMYLEEFDSFPELEYDKINVEEYFAFDMSSILSRQERTLNLLTSRGCPSRCIYCATHSVWDHAFRSQSAQNICRQVVNLKAKYNTQTIMFVDDNFTYDGARVKDFCRLLIKNNVKIKWYPSSVMINSLDEEMIKLMAATGCQSMGLAVESGTKRIQRLIRKNVKLDYAKKMADCMRREGMIVNALFILGFPGETIQEIKETIDYARELKCDWYQVSIGIPLHDTEMYEICKKNSYLKKNENIAGLSVVGDIHTPEFTPEQIESMAYDANFRLNFVENHNYLAGRYDRVLPMFEGVARTYPEHFLCKYMLWKIYSKTGKKEKADNAYSNLKSLYQGNSEYHKNLMTTYALDISF